MIEFIIKRDGRVEKFDPSKLIKWADWAASEFKEQTDWAEASISAISNLNGKVHSKTLQMKLIKELIARGGWANNRMAGRLYAPMVIKDLYGDKIPTAKEVFTLAYEAGLMKKFDYDDDEWNEIEKFIKHDRDLTYTYFQIVQTLKKYSIQNRHTKKYYESPQFTDLRISLALAENFPKDIRLTHAKNWYDLFTTNKINAPTPNYQNLGTKHNGFASCCLFSANDTAPSIAAGSLIANTMVYMSCGVGGTLMCRSINDPVRNGTFLHKGKYDYYQAWGKEVKANHQGTRGGAGTFYNSLFDPEAKMMIMSQNPRTPRSKQNRDLHFAGQSNAFLEWKAQQNEDVFTFNCFTAPDLFEKFYSSDIDGFVKTYYKYENDPNFKKNYVSARTLSLMARQQSFEVGTYYAMFMDEVNRHTPFKDPIVSGNLCAEICQPTMGYESAYWLYIPEDHGKGEVSMCSLAAIVVSNIESEEEYQKAAYYASLMVDVCIDMSDYPFPHIGFTAKKRRNAGIGIMGLATVLAREGVTYDTQEGRDVINRIFETHAWWCIDAGIRLGQERGNAEWIHKTKWPQGWTPYETYNRNTDELVSVPAYRNWSQMSQRLIDNGGQRFSANCAHMPTESSSKKSGAPNSYLPIRRLSLAKTDGDNVIDWAATDSNLLKDKYQLAWTISIINQIKYHAVAQKWTDQATSADLYIDRSVDPTIYKSNMLEERLTMVKYGIKSHYYQNTLTSDQDDDASAPSCTSGGCQV